MGGREIVKCDNCSHWSLELRLEDLQCRYCTGTYRKSVFKKKIEKFEWFVETTHEEK